MNILFVNPLRIGDTLMSWHVIAGLKNKYPNAQIDYLTFSYSKVLTPLLGDDVRFIYIDRDDIQSKVADIDVSIFRAFKNLEAQLKPVTSKKYDLVINYSNTKLSSYISSLVSAKQVVGSHFNSQKTLSYGSKWIEYLDLKSTNSSGGLFHFNEIFANALDIISPESVTLHQTTKGEVEVKKHLNSDKKKVVLQLFTSDPKKDFPKEKLHVFLEKLDREINADFLLLCMPGTEGRALPIANATWVPCSLEGAYSLVSHADALISVDTSIKHLASFTNTKIVELCFGGSRPQQTGAYKSSSLAITSKEYCYPCKHSTACGREDYYCSKRLDIDELALVISQFLKDEKIDKPDSFNFSVSYLDGRYYVLQDADVSKNRENLLTKLSWIYHLSEEQDSKVHNLVHFFIEEISNFSFERLNQNLIFLQRELEDVFRTFKVGERYENLVEDQRFLNLQGILKNLDLDFKLPALNGTVDFVQTRLLQNQLNNLIKYLNSYRKLSQDIASETKYYERAKKVTI